MELFIIVLPTLGHFNKNDTNFILFYIFLLPSIFYYLKLGDTP